MVAATEGAHREGTGEPAAGTTKQDSSEVVALLRRELREVKRELRKTQANPDKQVAELKLALAKSRQELSTARKVENSIGVAQARSLSAEISKLRVGLQNTNSAIKRRTGVAHLEALGAELKVIQSELGQIQGTLSVSRMQLCLILLGVSWGAIAVADAVFYSKKLWNKVQDLPGISQVLGGDPDAGIAGPDSIPTTATPLQKGDEVAGYLVTSGFGSRVPPCEGCSDYHPAVDLATPIGTPIYAPVAATVSCLGGLNDPAGNYAEIKPGNPDLPEFLLLHLDGCTAGEFGAGQRIGTTGATGNGTGPHLDIRQIEDGGYVVPTKEWAGRILSPLTNSLSDAEILCGIGAAEGTLNADCSPNEHYFGHIDPGNGAANQGAFSYQHEAATPAEADQKQLAHLRSQIPHYQAQARKKFGNELSKAALLTALDLHNQAPAAGKDFVQHLPTHDPSPEQIIAARSSSYVDP
ncbi:MAG: peptidoglycan DD-metalloendopeptidase family protein, partial [Cyanobacteria bacterium P01_F01_bin.86]